jgi:hypothetical protein
MAIGDYEQLDLRGMRIRGMEVRGEKIRASFGAGYSAAAVVGASHGLHRWQIGGPFLPDVEGLLIELDSKTWFRYHYEFFIERTVGTTEYFFIQWDNKYWTVKFAETEMGFEVFKYALAAQLPAGIQSPYYGPQGLTLEQVKISGLTYESDGSIDVNIPCPPMDAEALTLSETEIEVSFADPPEGCVESTATPCPPPIYWATGISESQVLIEFTDAGDDCDGDNLLFVDPSLYYYYA